MRKGEPRRLLQGTRLALDPGQLRESPATDRAAMTLRVLVSLEAFEDVVGVRVPGLRGGQGSVVRSRAGTAQEHYRRFGLCHSFLELLEESRIALAAGRSEERRVGNSG